MDEQRRLRVVIPMLTYVPGGMGGSETYAQGLVAALTGTPDLDLTVLVSRDAVGSFPAAVERVDRWVTGGSSTSSRLRSLVQGCVPTRTVHRSLRNADVVHFPFTVPIPPTSRPRVVTLLDVQHRDLPEMFSASERFYRAATYDRAARRAGSVLTISEFSKGRIVDRLGIDPERVVVAPLGVDATAFPAHFGPRDHFVFYPATAWPHKNHARLFEAMHRVRTSHPGLKLVLTGGRRSELGTLPDWVEHRGFVNRDALVDLYRRASCMVFPSLYEGFGLPALEAMASGCPVAAARAGSLPEVCGEAAIYFDPSSVDDTVRGIANALQSRDRLVSLGLERVRDFTWRACADVHRDLYQAAGRHRRG
jgi:glycosyltransferase involved in cell wall biosynthesis